MNGRHRMDGLEHYEFPTGRKYSVMESLFLIGLGVLLATLLFVPLYLLT